MLTSKRSFIVAGFLTLASVLTPGYAAAQDARSIMAQVDANAVRQNDSSFTVLTISTCKFGISGSKVRCSARATVKSIESAAITVGGGKDTQSIAFILEPASERGIGMLSYTYESSRRNNETWLYLSALGKVKRIVASNSANSEPVSMFGSEFTTEDQETGKIDDYTYVLLDTITYKGRQTYVIEQTPTPARARQSRYAKTLIWIDTGRLISVKAEMYDTRGTEIRRVVSDDIQKINGVWMARSITIMNLVTNRLSNMKLDAIHFGVSIDPALMTERALTDTAFRERHLEALRAQAR